jgi:hypothetical protein
MSSLLDFMEREYIRCTWDIGVYYTHIKSDSSISDPMLLKRLEERGYL